MGTNNLPPGCLLKDIEGPPMPRCEKCGEEHNDEKGNGLCEDCQPKEIVSVCAWCCPKEEQEALMAEGKILTHGICEACKEKMLAEIEK